MEPRDLRGKKVGVWWASSQHYSLIRFLEQMQIPYENVVDHYWNAQPPTKPTQWEAGSAKVQVVPVTREDMWTKWEAGTIHAAWVGFPHLYSFKVTPRNPPLPHQLQPPALPVPGPALCMTARRRCAGRMSCSN